MLYTTLNNEDTLNCTFIYNFFMKFKFKIYNVRNKIFYSSFFFQCLIEEWMRFNGVISLLEYVAIGFWEKVSKIS